MEQYVKNLGKVSPTVEDDDHSIEKEYDRLTIVNSLLNKKTYISRKFVPKGIEITNDKYWMFLCGWNIINDLNSDDDESALSAKAGKELKQKCDTLERKVGILETILQNIVVSANYENGTKIGSITINNNKVDLYIPVWNGTVAEYNAISEKQNDMIYNIIE